MRRRQRHHNSSGSKARGIDAAALHSKFQSGSAPTPSPIKGPEVFSISSPDGYTSPGRRIHGLPPSAPRAVLAPAGAGASSGARSRTPSPVQEQVLERQQQMFEKQQMFEESQQQMQQQLAEIREAVRPNQSSEGQNSVIRVDARLPWPVLGNGDEYASGTDVEEFYAAFATVTGLANNGRGMSARERLLILRSCLRRSRARVYDVILKSHEKDGLVEDKPEKF